MEQGDHTKARALYAEGGTLLKKLEDPRGVAESLEGLATILLIRKEVVLAVRLWGATMALRERLGAPWSPEEQVKYDRQMAQARLALGEATFASAWEAGRALTWEQAIACALEQTGP